MFSETYDEIDATEIRLITNAIRREVKKYPVETVKIQPTGSLPDKWITWYENGKPKDSEEIHKEVLSSVMASMLCTTIFGDFQSRAQHNSVVIEYKNNKITTVKVHTIFDNDGICNYKTEFITEGGPTDEIPERALG